MEQSESITLNRQSLTHLNETRKWTVFLSILGFIFIGLMLIAALFIGSIMSFFSELQNTPGAAIGNGFLGGLYVMLAVLYFFPIYYLYQFSAKMKQGIQQRSSELVEAAFGYLKSHYKFIGIFSIVVLAIYAVIILGAVAMGSMF